MRGRWKNGGIAVLLWTLLAPGGGAAQPAPLSGLISDVRIQAGEVFDPTSPGENHFVFRWANALHVVTRTQVIRRELLLDVGDAYDPALVEESERNLRGLGIFQSVSIHGEATPAGIVLWVHTVDRWTTELRTAFGSQGGITEIGIGLSDANLIGRAVELGGSVTSSTDVSASTLGWRDPRFLSTRWGAGFGARNDDLLHARNVYLEHPFYADASRWSVLIDGDTDDGTTRRFENGEVVDEIGIDETLVDGYGFAHRRTPALERWGLVMTRRRLRGDVNDDTAMLAAVWSRLRHRYRAVHDVDLFGAVEDVGSGWTLQFAGGADLQALGARQDRPFARADAGVAGFLGDGTFAGVRLRQHAFWSHGDFVNTRLSLETYGFARMQARQTLAWRAGAGALVGEGPEVRFNLGGDDRLRGYRARTLTGERILYANFDDRLFTDWRFYFVRLGAVVFLDAAAAWDDGETLGRDKARTGMGFGLRFGSNRVGSSLAELDFAWGASSFLISISNGSFFRAARSFPFVDPRPFR
jgi:hypothetical protein